MLFVLLAILDRRIFLALNTSERYGECGTIFLSLTGSSYLQNGVQERAFLSLVCRGNLAFLNFSASWMHSN